MSFKEYLKERWRLPSLHEIKENIKQSKSLLLSLLGWMFLLVTFAQFYKATQNIFFRYATYLFSYSYIGGLVTYFFWEDYQLWKHERGGDLR